MTFTDCPEACRVTRQSCSLKIAALATTLSTLRFHWGKIVKQQYLTNVTARLTSLEFYLSREKTMNISNKFSLCVLENRLKLILILCSKGISCMRKVISQIFTSFTKFPSLLKRGQRKSHDFKLKILKAFFEDTCKCSFSPSTVAVITNPLSLL